MTTAYIITRPLRLYPSKGLFFSSKSEKTRRTISIGELARAFPTDLKITAYPTEEAAKEALKNAGYNSSSSITPLILKVKLNKNQKVEFTETSGIIRWSAIKNDIIDPTSRVEVVKTLENMDKISNDFTFRQIYTRIQLPFSRALRPTSWRSNIACSWVAKDKAWQDTNISDRLVTEGIEEAFDENLDFLLGLEATFDILVGCHYPEDTLTGLICDTGSKGVLDFLIFPLLARKLITDTRLNERDESYFINALAWTAAIPLEIMRLTAGIALTLLLAPIVAIVTLIRACLPGKKDDSVLPPNRQLNV